MKKEEQFIGYLKFFGPSVEEGKIDIEKVGNSLVALNKLFKKYSKQKNGGLSLKLGGIKKNCTEVNIFMEQIVPVIQPVAKVTTGLLIAKSIGLTELGKQFFGIVGQQLALKLFSKGKKIDAVRYSTESKIPSVLLKDAEGREQWFPKEIWDLQKDFSPALRDMIQLEAGREEKMQIGYYDKDKAKKLGEVGYGQKGFFDEEKDTTFDERLDEKFDEEQAQEVKVAGKFVDYYGLAHEYHFSFQARKAQRETGKQKILCKVEEEKITHFIDLLKPENQEKNIYIGGLAVKTADGKIDKIKIAWFSYDEYYNPKQPKLKW